MYDQPGPDNGRQRPGRTTDRSNAQHAYTAAGHVGGRQDSAVSYPLPVSPVGSSVEFPMPVTSPYQSPGLAPATSPILHAASDPDMPNSSTATLSHLHISALTTDVGQLASSPTTQPMLTSPWRMPVAVSSDALSPTLTSTSSSTHDMQESNVGYNSEWRLPTLAETSVSTPAPAAGHIKMPMQPISDEGHSFFQSADRPPSKPVLPIAATTTAHHSPPVKETLGNSADYEAFAHLFTRNAQPLPLQQIDTYILKLQDKEPTFPNLLDLPLPPPPLPSSDSNKPPSDDASDSAKSDRPVFPPFNNIPRDMPVEELKRKVAQGTNPFQSAIMGSIVENSQQLMRVGSGFIRLEIVRDFVQFIGLNLSNLVPNMDRAFIVLFRDIPSFISLRLSSVFGKGAIFLLVLSIIGLLTFSIFSMLRQKDPNADQQGLEVQTWAERAKQRRRNMILLFGVTTLYLPLMALSLSAMVWSSDFWPVDNPYKLVDYPDFDAMPRNAGERAPDDFCYVTSMTFGRFNSVYLIIPLAVLTFLVLGIYFPFALFKLIRRNQPKVDRYDDNGQLIQDYEKEYQRQLEQDMSPYNFLYSGYGDGWSWYKVFIMGAKLLAVTVAVIVSKDNCIFRNQSRKFVELARQLLLIALNGGLLAAHLRTQAYLLPAQNYSETTSRAAQMVAAVIGIFIALRIGSTQLHSILLLLVVVVASILVLYFVLQNLDFFKRFVRKVTREVELDGTLLLASVDFDKHVLNRIWQETWSALFLSAPQFRLPPGKPLSFYESRNISPYLLDFSGTVAERHMENLKIARHIGLSQFQQALEQPSKRLIELRRVVMEELTGPDIYHKPNFACELKSYFGKAFVLPFPFCLVIVYDDDAKINAQLTSEEELEAFVADNRRPAIMAARENRIRLRALDGAIVVIPSILTRLPSEQGGESQQQSGKLTVTRTRHATWGSHDVGAGFKVQVHLQSPTKPTDPKTGLMRPRNNTILGLASERRVLGHAELGIQPDFCLTERLRLLFEANDTAVIIATPEMKRNLQEYRDYYFDMARQKDGTLSYAFFSDIYCNSELSEPRLAELLQNEGHHLVRSIPTDYGGVMACLYARLRNVYRSELHLWWYIFWDDMYRRNWTIIKQFRKRESDFSPYSPFSICYRPMPRAELEAFIAGKERGGYHYTRGIGSFIHCGILNRLYVRLDALVHPSAESQLNTQPIIAADNADTYSFPVQGTMPATQGSLLHSGSFSQAALYPSADVRLVQSPFANTSTSAAVDESDVRFPEPSQDGNTYW